LRIAMIGQRGVPATYGGVEHHVEELGARLVERGHDVTVYCRNGYSDEDHAAEYRGMRLRHLPTVSSKHLDAIAHSGLATMSALASHHDVVHYHALGPGLVAPLPRVLSRARVVLTVHGLDDERAKWSRAAQSVLRTAQWMSAHVPNATIAVSRALADHYAARHGRSAVYIPNGVTPAVSRGPEPLDRFGLEPSSYVLFVGRLVPEKAPDLLIRAFRRMHPALKLVVAGGSSHTDEYVADLRRLAERDRRVVLTGYVYGPTLEALYTHAAAFVLPSALEGLPLTLLEAGSYGIPIVASAIPPHLEVLGGEGPGRRLFASGDELGLAAALDRALSDPTFERIGAAKVRQRILGRYSWDRAAQATEAVYRMALGQFGDVVDLRSDEREVDVAASEATTVDLTATAAPMEEGAA
jgi:glycosyltransferase involved in cell wall biosynthesis